MCFVDVISVFWKGKCFVSQMKLTWLRWYGTTPEAAPYPPSLGLSSSCT